MKLISNYGNRQDTEMVDIMDQQSKLDKRRSRVEGMLCEIEYYIAMIEEK